MLSPLISEKVRSTARRSAPWKSRLTGFPVNRRSLPRGTPGSGGGGGGGGGRGRGGGRLDRRLRGGRSGLERNGPDRHDRYDRRDGRTATRCRGIQPQRGDGI